PWDGGYTQGPDREPSRLNAGRRQRSPQLVVATRQRRGHREARLLAHQVAGPPAVGRVAAHPRRIAALGGDLPSGPTSRSTRSRGPGAAAARHRSVVSNDAPAATSVCDRPDPTSATASSTC